MREYLQKNHLFEEKHAFCFQASLNMSRGGRREKPLAALKAFKDIWKSHSSHSRKTGKKTDHKQFQNKSEKI